MRGLSVGAAGCVVAGLVACSGPSGSAGSAGPEPDRPAGTAPVVLFDGRTTAGWRQAGPGGFEVRDGVLRTSGGMGLLWYADRTFADFALELDWRTTAVTDNSGVFVRFPAPGDDPWIAIRAGYEVQISDDPAGDPQRTGAIYGVRMPTAAAARPTGEWNRYRIEVRGQDYTVRLNDVLVNRFVGTDPARGRGGHVGLQNHDPGSTVEFRHIRVEPLPD